MILIDFNKIINILNIYNFFITGILHIGAYECEELDDYINYFKLSNNDIIWIEANSQKVIENKIKGIINIYDYLITNNDFDIIKLNISHNKLTQDSQSSSIFELDKHIIEHPEVNYISYQIKQTITIDTFFNKHLINMYNYNFLFLHIQGAELLALNGAKKYLNYVKCIYLKIHNKKLYKNNPLINDLDTFLNNNNFYRILTKFTNNGWGDALYIKINN